MRHPVNGRGTERWRDLQRATRSRFGTIVLLATIVALSGALAHVTGTAQAQRARAPSTARPEDRTSPDSARWVEACSTVDDATRAALRDVETAMQDSRAPLSAIEERLEALRQTPCFALAALDDDPTPFATTGVARAWWEEGGHEWASEFLSYGSGYRDELVLAPSRRSTLALEAASQDDPLRSLLCPEADESCGRETAGWTIRAEQAFHDHAREQSAERDRQDEDDEDDEDEPRLDCGAEAREEALGERYGAFRGCVAERRPLHSAMPVGRMRAPTRGWLVIRGRRGHYHFRDGLSAYDLATGAAYVASSDSALVLRDDGSVDGDATDAARRVTGEAGRLSVDAVRELAWMLFLAGRVEERFADVTTVALPRGIPLRSHDDASSFGGLSASGSFSSAQTELDWVWVEGGRVQLSGQLTWPESSVAANDHAVQLLRIAEATFAPGCVPARLTALPGLGSAGGVSAHDADYDELARTQEALQQRIAGLRASACR